MASEVVTMHFLVDATEHAILVINFMALVLIALGTVEAFFKGLRVMLSRSATGYARREVWLQYMRWLVAGLSFQLAADILATSVAPAWDELVRLAIIAVIRVFLNFFLEKDLSEMRRRQLEHTDNGEHPA